MAEYDDPDLWEEEQVVELTKLNKRINKFLRHMLAKDERENP
jgi:hypothetical protein